MNENQTKVTISIHVIEGATNFRKIDTHIEKEIPQVGQIGDIGAELTKLG